MKLDIQHRELVDPTVIRQRVGLVEIIDDALRHTPAWKGVDDDDLDVIAARLAFAHWRWHDTLRNRREPCMWTDGPTISGPDGKGY